MADSRELPSDEDDIAIGKFILKLRKNYEMENGESIRVLYIMKHTDLRVEDAKQIQNVMVKHKISLYPNGVKKALEL